MCFSYKYDSIGISVMQFSLVELDLQVSLDDYPNEDLIVVRMWVSSS